MSVDPGLAPETPFRARPPARRGELLALLALALSILIAITIVSIGIARASVLAADTDAAPLAIALFLGVLFATMGGLTAVMTLGRGGRQ